MIKKKLLALTTALACMASTAGMTVSAVSKGDCVELWDGVLTYIQAAERFCGIMVETDGTELTEETFAGYEGYQVMQTWEEFTEHHTWGEKVTSVIPEGLAYMASTYTFDEEAMTAWGRTLMMENPAITNVYFLDYIEYSGSAYVDSGGFIIRTKDTEVILDETIFPTPEGYERGEVEKGKAIFWVESPDDIVHFYTENGSYDAYAQYLYYRETTDKLVEDYRDVLSSVELVLSMPEDPSTADGVVQSVWDGAGDCNADGAVNAQDAAEQLMIAANAGTGGEIEITSANDINADGEVNALDAAAVLAYAAAQGSGENVSWMDILG